MLLPYLRPRRTLVFAPVGGAATGPNIVGKLTVGNSTFTMAQDTKQLVRMQIPVGGIAAKISAYMDGWDGRNGAQAARAVLYDSASGALIAETDETVIAPSQPPGWTDFVFSENPPPFVASTILIGLHAGASSNGFRVYGDNPGIGGVAGTDSYPDGASDPVGTTSPVTGDFSIFITYFQPWVIPDATDLYYASLPFGMAQMALSSAAASDKPLHGTCGWFGTDFDPDAQDDSSLCVVNTAGPLVGLVGRRLLMTRNDRGARRSVIAYCHADGSISDDEDIAVTRRLFMALGLPSLTSIPVVIQTLA